jgi:hypothetical protein
MSSLLMSKTKTKRKSRLRRNKKMRSLNSRTIRLVRRKLPRKLWKK